MPYHYEVSIGYTVPDGPDDFTVEEDVREFESMSNAIHYAKKHERDGVKVFLVFQDIPNGQLRDTVELPISLA